jgi:hypothetical protein
LSEEIFNTFDCLARHKPFALGVTDAKVFKKEDMFFSKEAVLKIADDQVCVQERETPEFIGEIVLAVFDPV